MTFLVWVYKSQDFAQTQQNFARSHGRETVTFRNSAPSHKNTIGSSLPPRHHCKVVVAKFELEAPSPACNYATTKTLLGHCRTLQFSVHSQVSDSHTVTT